MATFILKVNAHPAFNPFPKHPQEWEATQFFGPAPRVVIGSPEEAPEAHVGDRVHVWVNERGGGGGYTGYGKILDHGAQVIGKKNPQYEFLLTKARLLPSPLTGQNFWPHAGEAISSIRRYTLRQFLWLNAAQASEFEATLRKIAEHHFGVAMKNFV